MTVMIQVEIDSHTLHYLEFISGKEGEAAVNAWLKYTGWPTDDAPAQLPMVCKLAGAYHAAIRAERAKLTAERERARRAGLRRTIPEDRRGKNRSWSIDPNNLEVGSVG